MPVTYLGYPTASGSNSKVLETSEYQREMNGLETLTEVYTVRSANRIALAPDRDVIHSSFSTADIKYPRMAVENVSFSEQRGSLTKMSVTFVGLTAAAGLPTPIVRLVPTPSRIYIEAEYVSDVSETSLVILDRRTRMPAQINGVAMPANPGPTVIQQGYGVDSGTSLQDLGYCYDTTQCIRRGQFLVVRATFRKKTFGTGGFAAFSDL